MTSTLARPEGFVDPALGGHVASAPVRHASGQQQSESTRPIQRVAYEGGRSASQPVARRVTIHMAPPTIDIEGEPFEVTREEGLFFLRRHGWSLIGMGATVFDAERHLREEARDAADVFLHMDPAELDSSAVEFVEFLWRLV